ncbi:molybdate ABC transporter substrate-binding protein [Halarcobacter ebronensis]|uniref:Molybdate ABC transporter substrate-binding protein n=1 Tax=Halarcobacter ebronensis TaxID=1462615 RepID=A0A4Q0Y604_9BACT
MKYPITLDNDVLSLTKPLIYAQGSLAILSSKKQDFSKGINIVSEENIEKIAIANPKTAPYGKATVEALKNAKLYNSIEKKFVYGESISQTVAYSVTAAELGFIAKSSLYSDKMAKYKERVNWTDVDPKLYTPINQGIIILKNADGNKEVKAFYDFILSEKAKKIFKEFGYLVP